MNTYRVEMHMQEDDGKGQSYDRMSARYVLAPDEGAAIAKAEYIERESQGKRGIALRIIQAWAEKWGGGE